MESKGEISPDDNLTFYQCPKCKNVELLTNHYEDDLKITNI
jgi:predicted RNA-binding Zn-ribbon protein involved in translation (DUF1610 family)